MPDTRHILITDSVPLNGGDEALLRATLGGLRSRLPEAHFTVLCKDVDRCRAEIPDISFESDLCFLHDERDAAQRAHVMGLYRDADAVISSPGGFLHEYYDVAGRLDGMACALTHGVPLVLLGQSIGPFAPGPARDRLAEVLRGSLAVFARDERTRTFLHSLDLPPSVVHRCPDLVFLHDAPNGSDVHQAEELSSIALCFRLWPLHDRDAHAQLIARAIAFTEWLLRRLPDVTITFVSTCQGVVGYKDDSEVAMRIAADVSDTLRGRVSVRRDRLRPHELAEFLGTFDAFIGMRLHACLLAMIAGCPAMGIAYEPKTSEIFGDLNVADLQCDVRDSLDAWQSCAASFLDTRQARAAPLASAIAHARREAHRAMDDVVDLLRHHWTTHS